MNITIKNVKHSEFASQETHCFEATVYVDGKRAFKVSNSGHGGSDEYHGLDKKTHWAATHGIITTINEELGKEIIKGEFGEVQNNLEVVVEELVNEWLIDRKIKKP